MRTIRNFTVDLTQQWQDTGVDLLYGCWLEISATGTANWSSDGQSTPDGAINTALCFENSFCNEISDICHAKLIGKIGEVKFSVGSNYNTDPVLGYVGPGVFGRLYLMANDNCSGDNSGSYSATIEVNCTTTTTATPTTPSPCPSFWINSGVNAEISYRKNSGPCPGGHRCDRSVFDLYINDSLIKEINLNNLSDGGDRSSGIFSIPTNIVPWNINCDCSFYLNLRCKLSCDCHEGLAWVLIKNSGGDVLYDNCIPNDKNVFIGSSCGAEPTTTP